MHSSHDHPPGQDAPGDGDDLAWLRRQVDDIFGECDCFPDSREREDDARVDGQPGQKRRPDLARVTVIITVVVFLVLVVTCALTAAW